MQALDESLKYIFEEIKHNELISKNKKDLENASGVGLKICEITAGIKKYK